MTNQNFEKILHSVVDDIKHNHTLTDLNEKTFEEAFANSLAKITGKPEKVEFSPGSHAFPDIGFDDFGIEIKTTKSDKWVCIGNSIMEGTRRPGINTIYLVFLKKGGNADIKFDLYERTLSDIKITHSPRYEINMENNGGIFDEINTSYDAFRGSSNKIKVLKKYYRSKNTDSWFLDEETGENSTSMTFEPFSTLPKKQRQNILVELICIFPEIASSDYKSAAAYLTTKYGVYHKNLRDIFSASGRKTIWHNGTEYECSKLIKHLEDHKEDIAEFFNQNSTIIKTEWDYSGDVYNQWKILINLNLKSNHHIVPKEFEIDWIFD